MFLTGVGLLAIYASSSVPAAQAYGDEFIFLRRQAGVAFIGFLGIFLVGHIPVVWFERITIPLLLLSLFLLLLVQFSPFAHTAGGAARWLRIGSLQFQPAELAKIALILFLAKNLSRPRHEIGKLGHLASSFLVLAGFCSLLILQPDFGTAVLLFVVMFAMLFAAGLPLRFVLATAATGVGLFAAAVIAAPYRIKRLLTFLDPWQEYYGSGFQIIQSMLAFQSGGLFGRGLGESRQKLFFLPDAHTDFILAVIGEELGLIGVLLVCGLFAYLCYLGLRVTSEQTINYRRFLCFGITVLIACQAMVNMGVAMGLLPTKGIPLPFVSNGASSLIVFLAAIAILARLSQNEGREQTQPCNNPST